MMIEQLLRLIQTGVTISTLFICILDLGLENWYLNPRPVTFPSTICSNCGFFCVISQDSRHFFASCSPQIWPGTIKDTHSVSFCSCDCILKSHKSRARFGVTRLLHFRDIKFLLINLCPQKIRWWYVNTPLMQRKEYSNVVSVACFLCVTFIVPLTNLCRSNALVFSTSSSVKLASYLWKITRQACSEYTLFILRLTFKRGAPYSGRPVWCHCGFRAKTSRFSAGQQVCQQNPHYFQTHCCYHSNCSG